MATLEPISEEELNACIDESNDRRMAQLGYSRAKRGGIARTETPIRTGEIITQYAERVRPLLTTYHT